MIERSESGPVQLRLDLTGVEPPIWRRVVVPEDFTLGDLHAAIQIALGWQDMHLHEFVSERGRWGPPDEEAPGEQGDEDGVTIADVLPAEGDALRYEYDFGDGWQHEITREPLSEEPEELPVCTGGERAGPPEDSGGPDGYEQLLAALADPEHPDHQEMVDSLAAEGEEFDPERVDLDLVNKELRDIFD